MMVQTMCHNPTLPLEGVDPHLLLSFTSRECHMVPQPADDGSVMVCGCRGEHECNDKLIFNKGANGGSEGCFYSSSTINPFSRTDTPVPPLMIGREFVTDHQINCQLSPGFSKLQSKDVVPVVLVSLVPLVLVAFITSAAFYYYRKYQAGKPSSALRCDWPDKPTPERYPALDHPFGGLGPQGGRGGVSAGAEGQGSKARGAYRNDSDVTDRQGPMAELLPVRLEVLVGKGRFAEVWRGRLLRHHKAGANTYDTVAVKVFPAMEYASWRNECSIVSDPKVEHDNVVKFLAAEERGPASPTLKKFWLILAYHSLGNLQDFLTANILSWKELVAMAASIARGLAHLHSDTTAGGVSKVNHKCLHM